MTETRTALIATMLLLSYWLPGPLRANGTTIIEEVELEGKVVCLAEAMHQLHQSELPAEHEHVYGFHANDGTFYTLLRTKFSDAIFTDPQLREKDLLLRGRVFPKSQIFEVTRTRSRKNGAVHDLFYYCMVCSIESVSAGACACCWEPVKLVERPLRQRSRAQE